MPSESREELFQQQEQQREQIIADVQNERGPDSVIAQGNPGVIVVPPEVPAVFLQGLQGSLTKLVNGDPFLVGGTNIVIDAVENGSITITAPLQIAGSDGEVQYNSSGQLAASSDFTYDEATQTLTVPKIKGSLTTLANGSDYLQAGYEISITKNTNGSMTISRNPSAWTTYSGVVISSSNTAPTLPTPHNISSVYKIDGNTLLLMFNFSANTDVGSNEGAGVYNIALPASLSINTSVVNIATGGSNFLDGTTLGSGVILAQGQKTISCSVVALSSTTIGLIGADPDTGTPFIWGANDYEIGYSSNYRVSFTMSVPIVIS